MSAPGLDVGRLQQELTVAKHPRERAALVGKLLAALGDPLRCGQRCREEVLAALARADVEAWLQVVDTEAVRADLGRAAEAALESLLADGESERAEWESWALEALTSRDSLDQALLALERWAASGAGLSDGGRRLLERISAELAKVDGQAPALSRRLVAVNAARRALRDRLSAQHRERAWWYSSRSDCDALARLWKEAQVPEEETAHCLECAKDRHNARLAERPPSGCVTEDELWRLDLGELAPARRRLVERHALGCGECGLALQAVAVPLQEGSEGAPEGARPTSDAPQLLLEKPECKVLLFRQPRPRLVVAPNAGFRVAAASLELPTGQLRGAHATSGLEIDLASAKSGSRGKLRIELAGGKSLELDVAL